MSACEARPARCTASWCAPFDIRAGNAAMYFPEANVLVPTTTDPESKTPAFKCVLIALEPEPASSSNCQPAPGGCRLRPGSIEPCPIVGELPPR